MGSGKNAVIQRLFALVQIKDVVPTLEAIQKLIDLYHKESIEMLKLGCTLPNLANVCLVCTVLPVRNFIHSQKAIKIRFQKSGKKWLEDRQKCLHVTLLSKIWSCRIFNEWDRTAELTVFSKSELRKRLSVSIQMGCVVIARQCLKQWVVSIITVIIKKPHLPELKNTFNLEQKKGKWIKGRDGISRNDKLLSKCGNVNDGKSTRLL